MFNRLIVVPQYLLPKMALTRIFGCVARAKMGSFTTRLIGWFVKRYQVNMDEALDPEIHNYANFNAFFSRALRADARPMAAADYVCPVDGRISQFGAIKDGQIFQAKGHYFSTVSLLGGQEELAAKFQSGSFANLYLSPKDYHRIHMPCDGTLTRMIYIPGQLFSVSPASARGIPRLFARNERVICVFETAMGPLAMILIGATIVGSMATTWHGTVNPPRLGSICNWTYEERDIKLKKGEEMGHFMLGSTVIILFPRETLRFNLAWQSAGQVRLGELMAELSPNAT
jgi:phosphatidylserine decarboxylase